MEDEKHVSTQLHAFTQQIQDHIRDFGPYGIGACRGLTPPLQSEKPKDLHGEWYAVPEGHALEVSVDLDR